MTEDDPERDNASQPMTDGAEMLARIVSSHPGRLTRASGSAAGQPQAEQVLTAIARLLERMTVQVEALTSAPILRLDANSLAEALERGGKEDLIQSLATFDATREKFEADLAETHALMPMARKGYVRSHVMWVTIAIALIVGVIAGALINPF